MARSVKAHEIAGMVIVLGVALFLIATIFKTYNMAIGFIFPLEGGPLGSDNSIRVPTAVTEGRTWTVASALSTEVVTSTTVVTETAYCSPTPTVRSWTALSSRPVIVLYDDTSAEISMQTVTVMGSSTDVVCAAAPAVTSSVRSGSRTSILTLYVPAPTEASQLD